MSFGGFTGGFSYSGDEIVYNSNGSKNNAMVNTHLLKPPLIPKLHFKSKPLSENIKPKMEDVSDLGFSEKTREEEYESSENMQGPSGDDHENTGEKASKRKKYHRHTAFQIQELENAFKENPHPDEKARIELSRKLSLETKQVKFWFQNRRTQTKTQMERHENSILRHENDNLRIENIAIKEAMRNPICGSCGGAAALGEISMEGHQLRIENARLRDELNRLCILANKFIGKPLSSLPNPMSPPCTSDLELAVGRGLNTSLPMGIGGLPQRKMAMTNVGGSLVDDKLIFLELAMSAMNELVKLAQIDIPLWFKSSNGYGDTLNLDEYVRAFPPCLGIKPHDFVTEATRASGTVIISSMDLIQILMDSNSWAEMFPTLIGESSTIDLISSGDGGSKDGALQMMQAEFQLLSPLIPVRKAKFLRFSKQHSEGIWVVVDLSVVDSGGEEGGFSNCRRLPSGCIVQDMPNGYSKVIWIEHMEYPERDMHQYFRPLIESGLGFGAQKWIATLERQCECLAVLMSSSVPGGDHSVIHASGRKSISRLSQRMTRSFCYGVCETMHKWQVVQMGSTKDLKLMTRRSLGSPVEPAGVVVSAAITVLLPVTHRRVFDFLANEETRTLWDVLAQDGPVKRMMHIAKGHDPGNNISLLRSPAANNNGNGNQNGTLMLQETCTDVSGSTIVYGAVDVAAMNVVMSGGDSSCVAVLPSGFAILPYYDTSGPGTSKDGNAIGCGGGNGCLLTVGFQIMVNCLPSSKLSVESMTTVTTLISRTVEGIKANLQCN